MVASGRALRLGYFDHPPASWWLQWAAAHLFGTEAPLAVRAPFIALFALSTWLTYRLGCLIAGPRAGLWAAFALTLSPVFGVTTGTWVLPDGPLDCALLGAALCLMHAVGGRGTRWWIGAGLCAGLALFSKYTAVLTIAGAFAYLLATPHRRWLARPEPYLAGLLALAVFSPVVIWNASHHWASFAFQGDRADGLRFHPAQPFVVFAGEALFVLPWIWAGLLIAAFAFLRRGGDWRPRLLCFLAAPPILLFSLVALWSSGRVLYHWAAPGYLMLFPLLGAWLAERPRLARNAAAATAAFVVLGLVIVCTDVRLDWLHGAFRRDPIIEATDWTSIRTDLQTRGLLPPDTVVGVPNWRDAGKIAYALGPSVTVTVLNSDARQFGFVAPQRDFVGHPLLVLAPEHGERVHDRFATMQALPPAPIRAAGRTLAEIAVFRTSPLLAPQTQASANASPAPSGKASVVQLSPPSTVANTPPVFAAK